MIDLHCHLLPGLDDGAQDLTMSLEMARIAVADGISRIIATPHYSHNNRTLRTGITSAVQLLQEALQASGIQLGVSAGAEIELTPEVFRAVEERDLITLHGSRYFLLELPDLLPPVLETFMFKARMSGYVPVISHPERNYSLLVSKEKLQRLRDAGALFQVTAMSITGEFDEQIQRYAEMMLRGGYVDFVASDGHDSSYRLPRLSAAAAEVRRLLGEAACSRIFSENPRYVLEDREIL
ncbi:MAG: tyrosine-protein phosphatase [Thermodesulfovibrionales bacterium]